MLNKKASLILKYIFIIFCCIASATAIGRLFRSLGFPETNIVVVYIGSVVLASRFTSGYFYGIAATIIATCVFNYFFTEPYFTFSVDDPTYLITFAIMTITSIITSALTSKVKQNALEAENREAETRALYKLTSRLTDASDISEIAGVAASRLSEVLGCRAACLYFSETGNGSQLFIQQLEDGTQLSREEPEAAAIKAELEAGSSSFCGPEFSDWPICGGSSILGLIRIPKETAEKLTEDQSRLLTSMTESTALAMDRFLIAQQQIKMREEAEQERYRGNFLRAISHDLRTPLSGIMGTSEMIMGINGKGSASYGMALDIYKDADWLLSLVENILSITRLQEGRLIIRKEPEPVEEVVGAAVLSIEKRAPEREITVEIPASVLMVPLDATLIGQVLVNLLENAIKHTPQENEILVSVSVTADGAQAVFRVADRGTGIKEEDLPHIFRMFYTTGGSGPDSRRGVGLGLAICDSIVRAHGGSITARNREGGGAEFIFTLPMEAERND